MTKYSPDLIIQICEEFLSGKYSHEEICSKYGITYNIKSYTSVINEWIPRFLANGKSAFVRKPGNSNYSSEFKKKVVDLNIVYSTTETIKVQQVYMIFRIARFIHGLENMMLMVRKVY